MKAQHADDVDQTEGEDLDVILGQAKHDPNKGVVAGSARFDLCLLYTSDAADES